MVDGQQLEFEAQLRGQRLEGGDGLLAVGAVVIDEGDLLALELVHAAFLLADVLDEGRRLAPVGGGRIEDPLEDTAVGGRRLAIAHGQDRNLVHRRPRDQLIGDAGAVRVDDRGTGGALVLQLLVALDTDLGVVLGLALFPTDLDAVDAAVTLVEQREVVDEAVGDGYAVGGIRTRPVDEQRNEVRLLGPRLRRRADRERTGKNGRGQHGKKCSLDCHRFFSLVVATQ